jgi:CheY-like chemotaxis protein
LALQTVLQAGGYRVDSAASAAEAVGWLDRQEYALVLSDLNMESPEAGLVVLEHARMKSYRPATALFTSTHMAHQHHQVKEMLVEAEDLPDFLGKVAGLISSRASRRAARSLRPAS